MSIFINGLLLEIRYRHLPPRLERAGGSANATFRVIVSLQGNTTKTRPGQDTSPLLRNVVHKTLADTERERERHRKTDRQTERERERESNDTGRPPGSKGA